MPDRLETLRYKRSRFATRLPVSHRYTRSHYWLRGTDDRGWQVGLTSFATRMLGDLVECTFTSVIGDPVEVGQPIGSIEGFKAISDVYAVVSGRFAGSNEALDTDITVLERSPYDAGWLYAVTRDEAEAAPDTLDVHEYVQVLDATIDRMLAGRHDGAHEREEAEGPEDEPGG